MNKNALQKQLQRHQNHLEQCSLCPQMFGPPVHGLAAVSKVMLIGQAPGFKEIEVLRPFAWTAGKKLFSWFEAIGMDERNFRKLVYMSAICRCYPGKKIARQKSSQKTKAHGDRVPNNNEIKHCSQWLAAEIAILKPELIILVGKLAISQFMSFKKLDEVIGKLHKINNNGFECDAIPLPHPSGASTWPVTEPGKTLLQYAMMHIKKHPAWIQLKH
ncbi:MAG: uracil-DNA glycosylase [gamma proteobacterium symbiont of Taylorina sp.]|nr:uracil-DNA glycosylase [gamma proteobacterium symbiont of Taylorina sp.]